MSPVLLGTLLLSVAALCTVYALVGITGPRLSVERLTGAPPAPQRSALSGATEAVVGGVDRVMRSRGWVPFTAAELELAGVASSPASLVVLILSTSVIAFAMGFVVIGNLLVGLIFMLLVPLLAKMVLKRRTRKRRAQFANQLHEALQMMASALRAGHSLARGLDVVSQDSEAPMNEELARVVNENRLGRDLVDALDNVATRMESEDFHWVSQAIASQRETGGNLNEVLDQVAETIRERNHIRQQVFALSAEGRISAYILMSLPVGVGGFYALTNPVLMGAFVASGIGRVLLGLSAVMYVLGGLWMRKIVNIEF